MDRLRWFGTLTRLVSGVVVTSLVLSSLGMIDPSKAQAQSLTVNTSRQISMSASAPASIANGASQKFHKITTCPKAGRSFWSSSFPQ